MNPLKEVWALCYLGYRGNHFGIIRRYLSHTKEWGSHLEKCKRYIQTWAKEQTTRDVCVLGSGWLLDIPVDHLLEKFEKVFLVDLVHPRQVKRKYEDKPNIHFVQADITGGLIFKTGQLYRAIKGQEPWPNAEYPFLDYTTASLASINLLSQLAFPISRFMKKRYKLSREEEQTINQFIQQQHLHLLKKYPSCLISDHEEIIVKNGGNEKIQEPLLDIYWPDGQDLENWTWAFDTRKTYYPNAQRYLKVKACSFKPGA